MQQTPQDILQHIFGYENFRHQQEKIIQALLDGNDVLTLMPTGGGKSLCYQIPSMLREGTGIVISPLIALMQDQVDALTQLNIRAAFLNSSLSREDIQQTESKLLNNEIDLLYIAPERLLTSRNLNLLNRTKVALFAIDEAHCVSQWGHDFRKEYQQLSVLHEYFPNVPRIALTATADKRTRKEIIQQLNLHNSQEFVESFDRPNIYYQLNIGQNAKTQLWQFIETKHSNDAGIIYCLSRNKVEQIALWLQGKGKKALPYHAGLSDEERRENQARFLREDGIIIVATIAFGMGIDKPDVRFVAHLNLPKSIEAYYQETGRAGRDGNPADAWMAYGLQDVITLRQMTQDSNADENFKRVSHHKLDAMLAFCELASCRRQALLSYFGQTMEKPCGNCDTCLNPPETVDGKITAQKALSCVYRSGQRFGVNYLVDILLGKQTERIENFQHHKLSTFGIGKEYNVNQWRRIFRQLIARDFLNVDLDGYGALKLTEKCRPLFKGEMDFELHIPNEKAESSKKPSKQKSQDIQIWDMELFDALKHARTQLAKQQNVPPYVIFHDSTLQQFASVRPQSLNSLHTIQGVGDQKLEKYGKLFLDIIASYPLPDILSANFSTSIKQTLYLFDKGYKVDEIAKQRDLSEGTIFTHLIEAISAGLLNTKEVVEVSDQDIDEITNAIELLDESDHGKLKPIYEALDEQYDYNVIRCVYAEFSTASVSDN